MNLWTEWVIGEGNCFDMIGSSRPQCSINNIWETGWNPCFLHHMRHDDFYTRYDGQKIFMVKIFPFRKTISFCLKHSMRFFCKDGCLVSNNSFEVLKYLRYCGSQCAFWFWVHWRAKSEYKQQIHTRGKKGTEKEDGCDPSASWLHGTEQGACTVIQLTSPREEIWRSSCRCRRVPARMGEEQNVEHLLGCSKMLDSMANMLTFKGISCNYLNTKKD